MRRRIEEEIVRYLWWLKPVMEGGDGDDVPAVPVRKPVTPTRRPPALSYNDPGASRAPAFVGAGAAATANAGLPPGASNRGPQPARVGGDDAPIKTVRREEPKTGRNDPCWCGSGKKFKKCHGA
jgi:hypothetical protein